MSTLRETFLEELSDIYDAENQLVKALPKMARAAKNADLKAGFEKHLKETQEHVNRLEQVFDAFDEKVSGKKCKAMQGLVAEGEELIEEDAGDVALICAAQKVEHYEIAAYGSLKAWAEVLKQKSAAELLDETLEEERATDEKLTEVAVEAVNIEEESEARAHNAAK